MFEKMLRYRLMFKYEKIVKYQMYEKMLKYRLMLKHEKIIKYHKIKYDRNVTVWKNVNVWQKC